MSQAPKPPKKRRVLRNRLVSDDDDDDEPSQPPPIPASQPIPHSQPIPNPLSAAASLRIAAQAVGSTPVPRPAPAPAARSPRVYTIPKAVSDHPLVTMLRKAEVEEKGWEIPKGVYAEAQAFPCCVSCKAVFGVKSIQLRTLENHAAAHHRADPTPEPIVSKKEEMMSVFVHGASMLGVSWEAASGLLSMLKDKGFYPEGASADVGAAWREKGLEFLQQ